MTPESPEPRVRLSEVLVVPLPGDRVQLRGPDKAVAMRGLVVKEVLPFLIPLLDGSRCRSEIVEELRSKCDPERASRALAAMQARGLVVPVEGAPGDLFPEGSADHYEMLAQCFERRGGRYAALSATRAAHVAVIGAGPMSAALVSALTNFGFGTISVIGGDPVLPDSRTRKLGVAIRSHATIPKDADDWQVTLDLADAAVALVQGPILFYPWLEELNLAALEMRLPWTSAAIVDGTGIHIGPTITPGETACYKCFEMRFKSNVAFLEAYSAFEDFVRNATDVEDYACLPPLVDVAASLTALEVVRMVDPDETPQTSGCLLTFNSQDYSTAAHPVLKLPRCPACSRMKDRPKPRIWG